MERLSMERLTPIEELERDEASREKATAELMRGEISLEEYHRRLEILPPVIDLRKMAAELARQERRRKRENVKEKVRSFLDGVLRKNP